MNEKFTGNILEPHNNEQSSFYQEVDENNKKVDEILLKIKKINVQITKIIKNILLNLKKKNNISSSKPFLSLIVEKIKSNNELLLSDFIKLYYISENNEDKKQLLVFIINSTDLEVEYLEELFNKIDFHGLSGRKELMNLYDFFIKDKSGLVLLNSTFNSFGKISHKHYSKILFYTNKKKIIFLSNELKELQIEHKKLESFRKKEELNKAILESNNAIKNYQAILKSSLKGDDINQTFLIYSPIIKLNPELFSKIRNTLGLSQTEEIVKLSQKIGNIDNIKISTNIDLLKTSGINMSRIFGELFQIATSLPNYIVEIIVHQLSAQEIIKGKNLIIKYDISKHNKNNIKQLIERLRI